MMNPGAGVTLERYMVSSFLCGPSAPAALQTASVFWNPARPRSRCFHLPLYPCCPPPTDKRWLGNTRHDQLLRETKSGPNQDGAPDGHLQLPQAAVSVALPADRICVPDRGGKQARARLPPAQPARTWPEAFLQRQQASD